MWQSWVEIEQAIILLLIFDHVTAFEALKRNTFTKQGGGLGGGGGVIQAEKIHEYLISSLHSTYEPHPCQKYCPIALLLHSIYAME